MESKSDTAPLVVIVGETASGKSALAHKLAAWFNFEIIAADSRTVYKGMDIGTAKPTRQEQLEAPYHLLDISTPDKPITAADFKKLANAAIANILSRGRVPLLVGGSGLYVDAVLYDFSFSGKSDTTERERWHGSSVEELQAELVRRDIPLPANAKNPRHLVRQLETGGILPKAKRLRPNTLVIGIAIERETLEQRIEQRVDHMIDHGLQKEAEGLAKTYSWDVAPMQTIGYQEFLALANGQQGLEQVKAEIKKHTRQYAKRQRTWFRRNKSIHWVRHEEEAVDLITTFLNK